MPSSTILHKTQRYEASRQGRYFIVRFKQDHQVLSTSDVNGGQTNALRYLVNFQSVEGNDHQSRCDEILSLSKQEYHQQLADELRLDGAHMASMDTAVNLNNLVHTQEIFREITIDAFVSAGVKENALRAGDDTSWYQGADGNEFINEPLIINTQDSNQDPVKKVGTINIILMLNRSLTSGAQAKVATIITEAKSAALAELAIPSKQSSHLATGTGTDQYAIASPIESELMTLDCASGHLKLGELIGTAVTSAVTKAIGLQNSLERSDTRNVLHALGRFGATESMLLERLEHLLSEDSFALLQKNQNAVFKDAKLVAAAYAYAAVLDRLEYQTLSPNIQNDVLLDQAVNAAIAISGKSQQWQHFRDKLELKNNIQNYPIDLFIQAIAVGWLEKWSQ